MINNRYRIVLYYFMNNVYSFRIRELTAQGVFGKGFEGHVLFQRSGSQVPSSSHPRQPVPQRFKRTLLVCLEPPFAEVQLQGEYAESDEQTEGCATMGSQIQSEGEEHQRAHQ